MENVFQAGDVVYHPTAGKGEVTSTNGGHVYFLSESGKGYAAEKEYLSFSPWPAPNHIRPEPPIKEGWWLMHTKEDELPLVRYVSGKDVYSTDIKGYRAGQVNRYTFIRYLGKDWK